MNLLMRRAVVISIPLIIGLTGVFICVYLATQQNYRQSANDPQIQIAEQMASLVAGGESFTNLIGSQSPIDISTSVGTWLTEYDSKGTPLVSNGLLEGAMPKLPAGVFDTGTWSAQKKWEAPSGPETRITWQPNKSVRQAVVLVRYTDAKGTVGFVAVGRSLKTTEERIIGLGVNVLLAWVVTLVGVLISIVLLLFLGLV